MREAVVNDIADNDDINKIMTKALKKEATQKYSSYLNAFNPTSGNNNWVSWNVLLL